MAHPEGVELALGTLGEGRQAVVLAHAVHGFTTAGQNLVRIGLMTHVPHQTVMGRFQRMMERHGQLDHTEPGTEVPAGTADAVQQVGAQFVSQLAQLCRAHGAQRLRCLDRIEQWRRGARLRYLVKQLHRRQESVVSLDHVARQHREWLCGLSQRCQGIQGLLQ